MKNNARIVNLTLKARWRRPGMRKSAVSGVAAKAWAEVREHDEVGVPLARSLGVREKLEELDDPCRSLRQLRELVMAWP
jgi:hypothetical protein